MFLDGDVSRGAPVWVADLPTAVATREDQLRAIGAEPVRQLDADGALLRAAAASDAAFVPLGGGRSGFVGRPVDDGVAAVLRFPLPPGA